MTSQEIKIFVGLRRGYDGGYHTFEDALDICQSYCNEVGLCVTVTDTHYVYKGGNEPGVIVGLIRYPRFPETDLWQHAYALGWKLKEALGQIRVSIMDADEVVMLESNNPGA